MRVLVIGQRSGLAAALERRGIEAWVWNDRPLRAVAPERLLIGDFPRTRGAVRRALRRWCPGRRFTHVVASKESAVLAASLARRVVGARVSSDTMVLRCRDKLRMKEHLLRSQVPMTDFVAGRRGMDLDAVVARLGWPLVVKERAGFGARGMLIARRREELEGVDLRHRLLERYVDAPEASIESFVAGGEVRFANITQYWVKQRVNLVPAHFDAERSERLLAFNRRVVEAMRIRWGMTHLEVYLAPDGPIFGEIALRPPGGYIMPLLERVYGFDPWDAFLAVELDEEFAWPRAPRGFAAAEILHPGPGRVIAVEGRDELASIPSVVDWRLKVAPGDTIADRRGVSEEIGHVLLHAEDPATLLSDLGAASAALRVVLG